MDPIIGTRMITWPTRTRLVSVKVTRDHGYKVGHEFIHNQASGKSAVVYDKEFALNMLGRTMGCILGVEVLAIDMGINEHDLNRLRIPVQFDLGRT